MKQLVSYHKALCDETRLRIIALLAEQELCVCNITAVLSLPQSTVSRHLAVLRGAGLVEDRRHGTWMWYSLAPIWHGSQTTFLWSLLTDLRQQEQVQRDRALLSLSCAPATQEASCLSTQELQEGDV
ncbi:ArsR/SmtB family transcription factor [Chrysiogenes arsenatis]|uniref:ArsR/SmtB family transcription factor n=1 Tax=Chrysiogenes arsenatis TaxID=309797 RepID=UPI0004263B47|nr:metalloregulator ArsR/SmtB family transcription factor [Chrysiogenes arsenatis]